jgi:hypothetical protein
VPVSLIEIAGTSYAKALTRGHLGRFDITLNYAYLSSVNKPNWRLYPNLYPRY